MSTSLEYSQYRYRIQRMFKEYQFFYLSFEAKYERYDGNKRTEYKVIKDKIPVNFATINGPSWKENDQTLKSIVKKYIDYKYSNFFSESLKKDHIWWTISTFKESKQLDFVYDFESKEVVVLAIIYQGQFQIPDFDNEFNFNVRKKIVHITHIGMRDSQFYTIEGMKNLKPLFDGDNWDFEFIDFRFGPEPDDIIRIFDYNQITLDEHRLLDKKTGKIIPRTFYDFENDSNNIRRLQYYENVVNVYASKSYFTKLKDLTFAYIPEPTSSDICASLDCDEVIYGKCPTRNLIDNIRILVFNSRYSSMHYNWQVSSPRFDDYDYPHPKHREPSPISRALKELNPDDYYFEDFGNPYAFLRNVNPRIIDKLIFLREIEEGKIFKPKYLTYDVENKIFLYLSNNDKLKSVRFDYVLFLLKTTSPLDERNKVLDYLKQLSAEGDKEASFFLENWKLCSNLKELKNRHI